MHKKTTHEVVLRGTGASPGHARGPVRIVHNIVHLGKLVRGDVLVTPMTNPDMVVAMRKCVAIVTDSGGLTSHAAVISREFGIPCVTGTQNATSLLEENSIVEVDGTHGMVRLVRSPEQVRLRSKLADSLKAEFIIFGNRVAPFRARIIRSAPLSPRIDYEWRQPDPNEEYWWITPRPEIHGSLFQRSLAAAGIQRIPHAFGFDDLSPLYVRYYDNTAIHLDTIEEILNRLKRRLLSCDRAFWQDYLNKLHASYEEFDQETSRFQGQLDKMTSPFQDELANGFFEWLVVHNRFFSQTYLIQSMGDDIVWPAIQNTIERVFRKKEESAACLATLAAPISDDDLVTSTEFALDTQELIQKAEGDVRKIVESDLDEKLSMQLIGKTESGEQWTVMLQNHLEKWWWIRERDPYFDPITDEVGMLAYIRKHGSREVAFRDRNENASKVANIMRVMEASLDSKELADFHFLLETGRTLSRERDIHHHIWIRNVSIMRNYVETTGERLRDAHVLQHQKDVYFLTLPEVTALLEDMSCIPGGELSKRINLRMAHVSHVTKLRLHRDVNEAPPPFLDDAY